MKITLVAFYLSCRHLKVVLPGKLWETQTLTNCPICRKPREIKVRQLTEIWTDN